MKARSFVVGLVIVVGIAVIGDRAAEPPEPAYEIRSYGSLLGRGRVSGSHDTRVANPSTRTRRLTIAWQPPSCDGTKITITITNHHGRPVYDGPGRCEPFVVPIPAVEFVNIHLHGRGDYDLRLVFE